MSERSVLLHVPHASAEVHGWGVPWAISSELLQAESTFHRDAGTGEAAALAVQLLASAGHGARVTVAAFPASRLVADPERFDDDDEPMAALGQGRFYRRTTSGELLRHPDPSHERELQASLVTPHADHVANWCDAHPDGLIIDLHSYSPTAGGITAAVIAVSEIGWDPALNTPYSGSYLPAGRSNATVMLVVR